MKSALATEKQYLDNLDRRDKLTLASLGIVAAACFTSPVLFREVLPSPLKTLSLLVSAGSSAAIGLIAGNSKTQNRSRFKQSIDTKQEKLLDLYFAQDASVAKLTGDVVAQNQLLSFIGQYPVEQQFHYLKTWGLTGIAPYELMAAMEMMNGQVAPQTVSVPAVAVADRPSIGMGSITAPSASQLAALPDGAELIPASKLNNINRYPVIMVVTGQGGGKTATLAYIFSQLEGYKVFASPKPLTRSSQYIADLVYGFNAKQNEWLYFGKLSTTDTSDHLDFSWQVAKGKKYAGSMLDFLWNARRESMNRQLGRTDNKAKWHLFYDEAAYTYSAGFNDPQDAEGKEEARSKKFVSGVLRDGFMNFRGQKEQLFIGAQINSVETVGLKDMAKARDDAWALFPGLEAISVAESSERPQLAQYLRDRLAQGYGIALLVKQNSIFEVIELPTIAKLDRYSEGDTTVPPQVQETIETPPAKTDVPPQPPKEDKKPEAKKPAKPASDPEIKPRNLNQSNQYRDLFAALKDWYKKNGGQATDEQLAEVWQQLSGKSIDARGLAYLREKLNEGGN